MSKKEFAQPSSAATLHTVKKHIRRSTIQPLLAISNDVFEQELTQKMKDFTMRVKA